MTTENKPFVQCNPETNEEQQQLEDAAFEELEYILANSDNFFEL